MKDWEVIKELMADQKKVFTDGNGNCLKFTDEGLLAWHRLNGDFSGLYTFHRCDRTEWELLRRPVTWQEAIQAWVEGKKKVTVSTPFGLESQEVKKSRGSIITEYEITNGTWYVED